MRYVLLSAVLVFAVGCTKLSEPTVTEYNTTAQKPIDVGAPKDSGKKVWLREEFKLAVLGKNPDEVTDILGKPFRTSGSVDKQYWYYRQVTKNPATDKVDDSAQIEFRSGKVTYVGF